MPGGNFRRTSTWDAESSSRSQPMNHTHFGKMKYKDEAWHGKATLPKFPSRPAAPLPIVINDPDEEGPTELQEKAAQHLMTKTADVFRAVAEELLKSYRDAYRQEDWRETCGLKPIKSLDELTDEEYELREIDIE